MTCLLRRDQQLNDSLPPIPSRLPEHPEQKQEREATHSEFSLPSPTIGVRSGSVPAGAKIHKPRLSTGFRRITLVAGLTIGLGLASGSGCAGGGTPDSGPPESRGLRPAESRIDAAPGRTLVIPLAEAEALSPADEIPARFGDDRNVSARLISVVMEHEEEAAKRWLPQPGRWRLAPAAPNGRSSAPGPNSSERRFLALVLTPPAEPQGRSLHLGARLVEVNWIDPPSQGDPDEAEASPTGGSPDRWLTRTLLRESRNPLRRWRVRLVADRLARTGEANLAAQLRAARFDEPALEALARQKEDRWRAALDRLGQADATLAKRLRRALTALANFGDRRVPVWPLDASAMRTLRDDLLDPDLNDAERRSRARAWLKTLPRATAWVIDDAGRRAGPSGAFMPTVGVAERAGRAARVWLDQGGARVGPRRWLPPYTVVWLVGVADTQHPQPMRVRIGQRQAPIEPAPRAAPARPPGASLGPLFADWTLASWTNHRPRRPDAEHTTAALLQPTPDGSSWRLYLECRTPNADPQATRTDQPPAPDEFVRIFLGPTDNPHALLRIDPEGFIVDQTQSRASTSESDDQTDEQNNDEQSDDAEPRSLTIKRRSDRWSCVVPIPVDAIDPDGALRIAIQRVDERGVRTTWPRPMLPWRDEPGRAAIDLTAWDAGVTPPADDGPQSQPSTSSH